MEASTNDNVTDVQPRLLYECPSFLIIDKPHGMATVPLKKQAQDGGTKDTLLWYAASIDPMVLDVVGRNPWEGGAIHRLDTATAGLVMFARDQRFYDHMQKTQDRGWFEKHYTARTQANDALKGIDIEENDAVNSITSYFRPYGVGARQVRPTLDPRRAEPKVMYTTLFVRHKDTFLCTIEKGFRHQIRSHLAWTGHPIVGDDIYNIYNICDTDDGASDPHCTELQLECVGMSFQDVDGSVRTFMKDGFGTDDFPHGGNFGHWFAKHGFAKHKFAKNSDDGIIGL